MRSSDLTSGRLAIGKLTLGVLLVAGALSRAQSLSSGAGGAIRGTVVDVSSGTALNGATVSLYDSRRAVASASTNTAGQFAFESVKPGAYSLLAQKAGYDPAEYGNHVPGIPGMLVEVGQGGRVEGLVVRLQRFASVAGVVESEDGRPAAGEHVVVLRDVPGGHDAHWMTAGRSTTDDEGRFRITGLRPSEYLVAVLGTASAVAVTGAATTFYPDSPSPAGAVPIQLGSGAEWTGLVLRRSPEHLFSVSGVVKTAEGPPLTTMVHLVRSGPAEISTDLDAETVQSSAGGRFVFRGVATGSYQVTVVQFPKRETPDPPGTVPHMELSRGFLGLGNAPIAPLPTRPTIWARTSVTIVDADVSALEIVTRQGFRVSGRVLFDGTSPKPSSAMLATRCVDIKPESIGLGSYPAGPIGPNGEFQTVGLPSGRYFLSMLQTWDAWRVDSLSIGGHEWAGRPFDLDADVDGAVLTLTDRESMLFGSVRQPAKAAGVAAGPVDALVFVLPAARGDWGAFSQMPPHAFLMLRADPHGAYQADVLPGKHFVVAVPAEQVPEDWQAAAFLESLAANALAVQVGRGERTVQDLTVVNVAKRR